MSAPDRLDHLPVWVVRQVTPEVSCGTRHGFVQAPLGRRTTCLPVRAYGGAAGRADSGRGADRGRGARRGRAAAVGLDLGVLRGQPRLHDRGTRAPRSAGSRRRERAATGRAAARAPPGCAHGARRPSLPPACWLSLRLRMRFGRGVARRLPPGPCLRRRHRSWVGSWDRLPSGMRGPWRGPDVEVLRANAGSGPSAPGDRGRNDRRGSGSLSQGVMAAADPRHETVRFGH